MQNYGFTMQDDADAVRKTFNCLHIDDSCNENTSESQETAFVGLNELMEDVIAGRETLNFDAGEEGFEVDLAAAFFT